MGGIVEVSEQCPCLGIGESHRSLVAGQCTTHEWEEQ
jgi:hypothetical protein